MVVLCSCVFLVFTWSIVFCQGQNPKSAPNLSSIKGLGPAVCFLNGNFDEACDLETVLCDRLPSDCSAFVWTGAQADMTFDTFDVYGPDNDEYFIQLLKCARIPVYVTYGFDSLAMWTLVLQCCGSDGLNAPAAVEGLKGYLDAHIPIAGILLTNLDVVPEQPSFEDFTPNFKSYLAQLRQLLPTLQFGIYLNADQLQLHMQNPVVEWINFKEVNDLLDYVVIANGFLNKCSPKFVHGGLTPVTGNIGNTLEKNQAFIDKAGITKEKLYLRFELYATDEDDNYSYCTTSFPKMCIDPRIGVNWCADNIGSFYEKGVFAQKHASGFTAAHVDMDDVNCVCQCNRSYPAFRAILDGFKGAVKPPPCSLFDRT